MMSKLNKKNAKGFTLVEVIVVAVIVAVLAAVAIPLYLGYVKDSRLNVAASTAGSIASMLAAAKNNPDKYTAFTPAAKPGITGEVVVEGATNVQVTIPSGFDCTITGTLAAGGIVKCQHTKDGTFSPDYSY